MLPLTRGPYRRIRCTLRQRRMSSLPDRRADLPQPSIGQISTLIRARTRRPSSVSPDHPSIVFFGFARIPGYEPAHVPVFFKLFRIELQKRALFNELLGHRVAQACGLPVSQFVCECVCPREVVPLEHLSYTRRATLKSPFISGVASVDADARTPMQSVRDNGNQTINTELWLWPYLPATAVVDELLLNLDRHLSNIHRVGKREFVLIDHERVLGGLEWDLPTLSKRTKQLSPANYVATFIAEDAPPDVQGETMRLAQAYAERLQFTEASLQMNFSKFDSQCHQESGTTEAVVNLLNERCKLLPQLILQHMEYRHLLRGMRHEH